MKAAKTTEVVIETSKGSRNKLAYEPRKRMYKLSKVLAEGMSFPYDFGFVPNTLADDGDPIDVLVDGRSAFSRMVVGLFTYRRYRVGAARGEENGPERSTDRGASESILYFEVKDVRQLNASVLGQIEAFFINYQNARAVKVKILGRQGPEKAWALLQRSKKETRLTRRG